MPYDEAYLELQKSIVARATHLEARCDALAIAFVALAKRSGLPIEEAVARLAKLEAQCLQERMQQIEDIDPGIAADIDHLRKLPDLDF